jgi:hypothetical protein
MSRPKILLVDAAINFILGFPLLTFPLRVVQFLGMPEVQSKFYPSIFGAVLIGIAFALSIEYFRKPSGIVGLGLGGAVSINLCAGLALGVWLLSGQLEIPSRGKVILWTLAAVLIIISGIGLAVHRKRGNLNS